MSQFIDGKRCQSLHGRASVVRDPSNGDTIAEITLAEPDDVDRAVQAARAAFPGLGERSTSGSFYCADDIRSAAAGAHGGVAQLESRQAGKPIRLAREFDVAGTIDNVAFFAGAARHLEGKATASTPQTTPPQSVGSRSG